jgi:hypothetical protein
MAETAHKAIAVLGIDMGKNSFHIVLSARSGHSPGADQLDLVA